MSDITQIYNDDTEKTQMVTSGNESTMYAANIICPVCKAQNPPLETYCIDCGFMISSEPVEEVEILPESNIKLVSSDGSREFILKPGDNSVGRENADVLLSDPAISRHHAIILIEDNKITVTDVGSTNATTVNKGKLAANEPCQVKDGDELAFGGFIFKLVVPEKVTEQDEQDVKDIQDEGEIFDNSMDDELVEISAAVSPNLKLQTKDGITSFDLKDGVNSIGRRAGDNDIVLSDSYSSGKHASIEISSSGIILTDVGSTNGTLVNGVRLEANIPRVILLGDEITMGQSVYVVAEV